MEALKRVSELGNRQITDQVMEHPKPVTDLSRMLCITNDVMGNRGIDVGNRTPELALVLHPMPLFAARRDHTGHLPAATLQLRQACRHPLLNMTAKSHQIAHDKVRAAEHIGVQALHHKRFRSFCGCNREPHQKGVIDVAGADRVNRVDLLRRMKATRNVLKVASGAGGGQGHDESHASQNATLP